jgi:hypothetical protein
VPTLLALGVQPYHYNLNLVALTAQLRFDTASASTTQK